MDDRLKAVKKGIGNASDHDLAKYCTLACLDTERMNEITAMMVSELCARVSGEGWTAGVDQWIDARMEES